MELAVDPTMNHLSLLMSISVAAQVPTCTYKLPSKQEGFQGLAGKLVKAGACTENKLPKWDEELGERAEQAQQQGKTFLSVLLGYWVLSELWRIIFKSS